VADAALDRLDQQLPAGPAAARHRVKQAPARGHLDDVEGLDRVRSHRSGSSRAIR
jgi:hypothetical protein